MAVTADNVVKDSKTSIDGYAPLAPGFMVALALDTAVAGLSCWVGEIQDMDARGVRITLIDWIVGVPGGYDFYAPWSHVVGVYVATPDHHAHDFHDAFGAFQTRHNDPADKATL